MLRIVWNCAHVEHVSVPCSTRIPVPLMYQYMRFGLTFTSTRMPTMGNPASRELQSDAQTYMQQAAWPWCAILKLKQPSLQSVCEGAINCEVGKDEQTFKHCDNALVFHATTGLYDLIIQLQKHKHVTVSTVYLTIDQGVQFHNFKSSFPGFPHK